LQAIMGT